MRLHRAARDHGHHGTRGFGRIGEEVRAAAYATLRGLAVLKERADGGLQANEFLLLAGA